MSGAWGADRERIVVIGNGGGGKTTLAAAIATATGLPHHEVDRIQFLPDWETRPEEESRAVLAPIIASDRWVLDGFGPFDTIETRFARADTIVWVDHPLWVHFWWAAERQIAAALGGRRHGGPGDCPLDAEGVTERMFRAIGFVHDELRPRVLSLVETHRGRAHVIDVTSPTDLDELLAEIRGAA